MTRVAPRKPGAPRSLTEARRDHEKIETLIDLVEEFLDPFDFWADSPAGERSKRWGAAFVHALRADLLGYECEEIDISQKPMAGQKARRYANQS